LLDSLEVFHSWRMPTFDVCSALVKHYDNVGHYYEDPHLKAAFTFQNMYLGWDRLLARNKRAWER